MRGEEKRLTPRERHARITPYLVFGVSLIVTAISWRAAVDSVESKERVRYLASVERARNAIHNRIDRQVELLRVTAAMITTQGGTSRDHFRRFCEQLGNPPYPGMASIGYSAKIPPAQREAVIDRMKREGFPDFQIFPASGEAHAILYVEPEPKGKNPALGFNMHSEPVRAFAMDWARDRNQAAVSGQITLRADQATKPQPSFIVYYPVYWGGDPHTVEERRKRLAGYVYSPFRVHDLLDSVLKDEGRLDVAVAVFDGPRLDAANQIYNNVPETTGRFADVYRSDLPGHTWTIRYVTLPAFEETSDRALINMIPLVGLLVSLMLGGLSLAQARGTTDLARIAEELHKRAYRQRLLAQAGVLLGESLDVDQTLGSVARLTVPSFADWCAVDLANSEGGYRRVATAHIDPQKLRLAEDYSRRFPPRSDVADGVSQVLQTGRAELFREITPAQLEAIAQSDEQLRLLRDLGLKSVIVAPLKVRERTVGTISFVWAESGFLFDEEDLALAEEIGLRAGMAIENAELFAEKQRELEERRRAEERVRDLNENLERLVRERTTELEASNRELEAFCYSVSHDLRAPLRSVDGFSKAVIEDYGEHLYPDGIHYLGRVRAAARRMDELITALLSLSRLTRAEIHREPVNLTDIAEDIAAEVHAEPGAKAVEFTIAPDLRAEADAKMVRIVLDNLVANAVKFSARSERPQVEIGKKDGAFFVRDNGVGFNPQYSRKLFAPFERLHSADEFPGSGIGLATVQRVVARHGGRVWAESEEGRGATFYFTLE